MHHQKLCFCNQNCTQRRRVEICENKYLITSLTKACKYKNDQVRIRLPISKTILHLILNQTTDYFEEMSQPYLTKLYCAMFASGYYGLLRVGEMASGTHPIKASNVHVADNKRKILFVLRTSKTHWTDEKPQIVKISSSSYHESPRFCPYKLLRQYVEAHPKCTSKKEVFFVFSNKDPVTPVHLRKILKLMLQKEGLEHDYYNVHSLRIGRAVDLHDKLKISVESVKKVGRWCSNSVSSYLSQY